MDVDSIRTPFYNQLYQDYITKPESLSSYLTSYQNCNWVELIAAISRGAGIHTPVKKILAEQNADQTSPATRQNVDHLQNPRCVMVVTGQQLGLFASPLYTVYKALTAVKLTQKLNAAFPDIPFIPLFWLESEDHDFAEVNHIGIWDNEFNPRQLIYQGRNLGKVPIRYYQIDSGISVLLEEIKTGLLTTEFTAPLLELLTDLYRVGQNWVEASRLFLSYLFSDWGMLFFQPGAQRIKEISVSFFDSLLDKSDTVNKIFSTTSQELQVKGYTNQVPVVAGKTFIHVENENRQREHLYYHSDHYYLKDSAQKFTIEQARKWLTQFPQRISGSVISRPLWQSWLLPTVVYVAGPAEIAYWAQMAKLFDCFDLPRPVVYPRVTATVIEPKITRFIQKHQPEIENVNLRQNEYIDDYFKHRSAASGSNPLQDISAALKDKEQSILTYLGGLDPTLVPVGEKVIERIQGQLESLQSRIINIREQKENLVVTHLNQVYQAILPEQQLQERYISVIYFLNKFGPAVVKKMYTALQIDSIRHQLLYL
jgi:bacillithiol biosynthesis cysteine-adding enzyme BshC